MTPPPGKPNALRTSTLVWLAILLALVAAAYAPGLGGSYVFDDYPNIVNNSKLHIERSTWPDWLAAAFSSPSSSLQRPLAMLSFAANHYFTGLDPWPMKLTNISIHLLNTILVFGLVRLLLRAMKRYQGANDSVALFATACWALHPINLMAVLFIVQRMESLSHSFVFAGLALYVIGRSRQLSGDGGWPWVLSGLLPCTLFGLLVKESAALLPLYAFCLELCVFDFSTNRGRRDRRIYALFVAVLALPAALGLTWLLPIAWDPASFASREFTLIERLLTESRVVLDYLHWTLLPNLGQLSLYHDDYLISHGLSEPPTTALALIALPTLFAVAWICRRRRPLVALGIFWFLCAHLLTATIIPLELVFEHRNYFASLGVCLALTDLLLGSKSWPPRRIGTSLAAAFLFACFSITYLRAKEWSDPVRFARSEAAKHPDSARATYELARTMIILTDYDRNSPFVADTLMALDRARKVPRSGVLPLQASLIFAARTGQPTASDWWSRMEALLSERPVGPQETAALASLTNCALEGHCRFPPEAMLGVFAAALTEGSHPEVMNIYGNYVLRILSDSDLALRLWQEANRLRPSEPEYYASIAKLLIELRRYDEARAYIARLRKLGHFRQNWIMADALDTRLELSRKQAP